MRKHIDLYVNNFSVDLGEAGKNAVLKLMEVYKFKSPDAKVYPAGNFFIVSHVNLK